MAISGQKRIWIWTGSVIAAAVILIIGAYLLLGGKKDQEPTKSGLPRMANLPPKTEPDAPPPPLVVVCEEAI